MKNIQSLLAVFAHPDDESYRAGGTLALLAQRGVQVWVLCATRGEQGIPNQDPEKTGQIRQAELECACRTLGVEPPWFLDYLDGALLQVDEDSAVGKVVQVIRRLQPQALLTWPPSGVSGHPDHIAVSGWTGKAFQLAADPMAYPRHNQSSYAAEALYHIVMPSSLVEAVKMFHLHSVPDEEVTHTVDVAPVWDVKMAAIRCHHSQIVNSPILDAPEKQQLIFL